jgi:hypothetical protein
MRFTKREVLNNFDEVCQTIRDPLLSLERGQGD